MDITYRRYQPGDETEIIVLYNLVFQKQSTIAEWAWMYQPKFGLDRQIMLAFDGDRLVGQAAGVSLKFFFQGREILGSRTQNVMVHPEYRKKGIFLELLDRWTKGLKEDGIDFVLTFPNDNSLPAFVSKLDFEHLFDIKMYQIPLQDIPVAASGEEKMKICTAGEALEHSYQGILREEVDGFTNHRSPVYLKWRYLDPPGRDYRFLVFERGGEVLGYLTFKRFGASDSIDILDISIRPDLSLLLSGLGKIVKFYQDSDIEINHANLWSRASYFYHDYVDKAAVPGANPHFHVVVREFTSKAEGLLGEENLYITMADSDLF